MSVFTGYVHYALCFLVLLNNRGTRYPHKKPIIAPTITSDGKCTYKYKRENAIKTAKIYAKTPNLRLAYLRLSAAANDETVCPDGNEKSWGIEISKGTSGLIQHGLGRATSGFKVKLQIINPAKRDNKTNHPFFRCFGKNIRIIPDKIQIAPEFPKNETNGIKLFKKGQVKNFFMLSKITKSSAVIANPFEFVYYILYTYSYFITF